MIQGLVGMKVAIIGCGHVGRAMEQLFPQALRYDPGLGIGSREAVMGVDVAFLCLPTPSAEDGSCDTSIVESVIQWLEAEYLVIRSTVSVGFTERMRQKYNKRILFQPEYYGETPGHPFADLRNRSWITLGGEPQDCEAVAEFYRQVYGDEIRICIVGDREAELSKYMTNAFLASKVVFCNMIYDAARKMGVDYEQAKTAWLLDPRIGESHTRVFENDRGFGGSCFPKDTRALQAMLKEYGVESDYLDGMILHNESLRKRN